MQFCVGRTSQSLSFLVVITVSGLAFMSLESNRINIRCDLYLTIRKVSLFGVFLVLIFLHSDGIRRDTEYLSVFSSNAGKYGPEKLRIRTLLTQYLFLSERLKEHDNNRFCNILISTSQKVENALFLKHPP